MQTDAAANNSELTSADSVISLIEAGNALEEQGRPSEAMKCYEAAVQADARCARAHMNRGNILLATACIDEARHAYQLAVACDPRYAAAYFNLANLNCRAGEYQQALRHYGIAIDIKPDFADAFVALGNALADLGRDAEAVESYRRALAIEPNYARSIVTKLFDDYASRFETHLIDALGYSVPKSMRDAVGRYFGGNQRFQHALDLGCGTGLIGEHFRDLVVEIDGVDLSPKMLEQAHRKQIYSKLDCDEIVAWLDARQRNHSALISFWPPTYSFTLATWNQLSTPSAQFWLRVAGSCFHWKICRRAPSNCFRPSAMHIVHLTCATWRQSTDLSSSSRNK